MIIVQLKGGLGNQLFQYAAGLSLARHHNVEVKVDISELKQPDEQIGTIRNYELNHIRAIPAIASMGEVAAMTRQAFVIKYAQKLLPSYRRIIYNEKQFSFDPHFFDAGSHIYLKGYRQSEQYFLRYADEIRRDFQLQPALTRDVESIAEKMRDSESVSIHIRRGDYDNAVVNDYHGTASQDYYRQAIAALTEKLDNPVFYVFSDNMEWVAGHLQLGDRAHFVSGSLSKNHYEDFFLMSQCRHHIIANSSFSWWSAWLYHRPEKIVIAPIKWFNNAPYDTRDLLPPGWIRM